MSTLPDNQNVVKRRHFLRPGWWWLRCCEIALPARLAAAHMNTCDKTKRRETQRRTIHLVQKESSD